MRRILSLLLICLMLPTWAAAQGSDPDATEAQKLREAIRALPDEDPAVAYAKDLRLEGGILVGGAVGLSVGMLFSALGETIANTSSRRVSPALVGISMGLSLGAATIGLPALFDGQRYLAWYATHDRPPTRLAKLKLLRRWRVASLNSRRIAAAIGTGFLGASTAVVGGVWASREASGVNGTSGRYDPTDALVTVGFAAGTAGAAVALALSDQAFRAEKNTPHRLYAPPPTAVVVPVPVVDGDRAGIALSLSLSGSF